MTDRSGNPLARLLNPAPISDALFPVRRLIGIAVFAVIALTVGMLADLAWQASLALALLTVMGALALNLLMGTAGQVSIGSAGLIAVGAFSSTFLTSVGVPFGLDVVLAALLAGVVGLIIGIPALRLRGLYLAIATLAAHFIILFAALRYQNAAAGPSGFILPYVIPGKLAQAQDTWYIIIVVVVVLTLLVVGALMSGRTGRTWRMIRDHENIVSSFGINATRWKLGAFVISSVILGVQGSLFAHFSGSLTVESFHLGVAISYIAMVVIGGLDSLAGAVIGALVISLLPDVVPAIIRALALGDASAGAHVSVVIYGALILVVVVFLPTGITGGLRKVVAAVRRSRTRATDDARSSS